MFDEYPNVHKLPFHFHSLYVCFHKWETRSLLAGCCGILRFTRSLTETQVYFSNEGKVSAALTWVLTCAAWPLTPLCQLCQNPPDRAKVPLHHSAAGPSLTFVAPEMVPNTRRNRSVLSNYMLLDVVEKLAVSLRTAAMFQYVSFL